MDMTGQPSPEGAVEANCSLSGIGNGEKGENEKFWIQADGNIGRKADM